MGKEKYKECKLERHKEYIELERIFKDTTSGKCYEANTVEDTLSYYFQEVDSKTFYQSIFYGLEEEDKIETGKYVAIASQLDFSGNKTHTKNRMVFEGLDMIDELIYEDNYRIPQDQEHLTIISGCTFAGRHRRKKNARALYALIIEIDDIKYAYNTPKKRAYIGITELLWEIYNGMLPCPTYIASSGSGIHLYYVFEKPIPLFENVYKSLNTYKQALTRRLWNPYVTFSNRPNEIQYESIIQGFRMVGTRSKLKYGTRCRAYKVGNKVSVEYMNRFIDKPEKYIIPVYMSKLTRAKAKELYPQWYERKVVRGEKRGKWVCNEALYEWWLRRLWSGEVLVGHRYYALLCLSIYAIKCEIDYERLKADAYSLLPFFEKSSFDDNNHFTEHDVESALMMYKTRGDNLTSYPIAFIEKHSGLDIKRNKRRGNTREQSLIIARTMRDINYPNGEWRKGNGRKPKEDMVVEWRQAHPTGTKAQCIRETGLSKPTVYKWWSSL